MVTFLLCAWFAVLTIFGLRHLIGPDDDNEGANFHVRALPNKHELELRVTVSKTDGRSWRVVHRFNEEEIKQIIRVCYESIDVMPKRVK
jgi:hypothetical protein